MPKLQLEQRVRYPPFESHRFKPTQLPIASEIIVIKKGTMKEIEQTLKQQMPGFTLGNEQSWLVEQRYLVNDKIYDDSTIVRKQNIRESSKKPLAVKQQRQGWYLTPNPIHAGVRKFISGAVVVLLVTLGYLFIEPVLASIGIPGIGTSTVRIGLLDYPMLAVLLIPLLFFPLMLRVAANLSDLLQQRFFLKSSPKDPIVKLLAEPVAGKPLEFSIEMEEIRDDWRNISITWRVGALPPSRSSLFNALGRTISKQPPPGLTTELPHHWDVGLDDGTGGGEDAPMEDREVKGGLFLRPMRAMEFGERKTIASGAMSLKEPSLDWPGTISSDLIRIHWEMIVSIERETKGNLLWVMPIAVSHQTRTASIPVIPTNDGRTESDSV